MFGIMKRFLLFTLFAIAVNLVFLPCVYAYSAWPMFGHDARHTGRSPYVGPDTPVLKWVSDPIGIFRSSSPVIGPDGTIYIGSDNEYLYAISPNDGSVKWGFLTHGDIVSTPAIGYDGTIHVVSEDGYLYAIQSDGILRWKYLIHGNITSPTIGMDGTIYVAGYEGTLYAIEPTGTLKWKYNNLGGIPTGAPAIGVDGTVYVTTDPGLQAIAPDGTLKWIYDEDSPNWDYSSPAIGSDGTIYYMGTHELYAITPDGKLKWKTDNLGPYGLSSPAIGADGTVYVAVCSGVFAINGYNGSTIWHYPTHTHFAPAIDSGGTIYVGGRIALTSTGNVKWTYDLGVGVSPSYSLAIGADKTLYIAGKQDMTDVVRLYAITVPEPCTMLLMGVGLAGLVGVARRRKTKHHA